MKKVAEFEKVSFKQFYKDFYDCFPNFQIGDKNNEKDCFQTNIIVKQIWNQIKIPKRATKGSAGHDFSTPIAFELKPNTTIKIPTGIKCKIENGYVMLVFPRSSIGFKYRVQLDNTIGVIDSDYYNNENNEGHIFVKITNDSKEKKTVNLNIGEAFCQALFVPFGVADTTNITTTRNGGIGSTTNA